jgi:hypothetical protein
MRRNIIINFLIVLLVLSNLTFIGLYVYERSNNSKLNNVWKMATNNAVFLYKQYDDLNIPESYDFAVGEIGTICNLISYINFGGNKNLTETQTAELGAFYQNLQYKEIYMKEHITEVIEIVQLLQVEDIDAFNKMIELREKLD